MEKEKFSYRGSKQYIITMLISFVSLAVMVVFTFTSVFSFAKRDALAIGEASVNGKGEVLDRFVQRSMDILHVTAHTTDYMLKNGAGSDEIENYLKEQTGNYTRNINQNLVGIYGVFGKRYIDGTGWVPPEDYNPKDRPWYKDALKADGSTVFVSPYEDAVTGNLKVSVSQLLSDKESVISLDIYLDGVQNMAENLTLNGKGYGFIVDEKGFIVAHNEKSENGKNILTHTSYEGSQIREAVRKISGGDNSNREFTSGKENFICFSKKMTNMWNIILVTRTDDLYQGLGKILVYNIFSALVILLAIAYFGFDNLKKRNKITEYAVELNSYKNILEEKINAQKEELNRQSGELTNIQDDVIEGIASVIEMRDGSTGSHVTHTREFVRMILDYMLEKNIHPEIVDAGYAENITRASILHDVGKIKIPDAILNKPGKFTKEEFEVMKTHTTEGKNMMKRIFGGIANNRILKYAEDIALYHHEKWDGSGYPAGIYGEYIPLCARIMAVADVFDALISKRVYKDKMSTDEAYNVLKEESGRQFDPEIVEIFCSIRGKVEEYIENVNREDM